MELFSLKNKTAIVTGSLGLIGRQHCFALAEAGANIVVTDMDAEGCEVFARELNTSTCCDTLPVGADITSRSSITRLRKSVIDKFGGID
ncbi:MAG: SDR family NAD(P)-dependent oxidoreductase, partial [Bacteroidota bacterium]